MPPRTSIPAPENQLFIARNTSYIRLQRILDASSGCIHNSNCTYLHRDDLRVISGGTGNPRHLRGSNVNTR